MAPPLSFKKSLLETGVEFGEKGVLFGGSGVNSVIAEIILLIFME